jgi:hypothetical protein
MLTKLDKQFTQFIHSFHNDTCFNIIVTNILKFTILPK